MASYFDELQIEENETQRERVSRLNRETFLMLLNGDPRRYGEILNLQRVPPAAISEIEKLKAPLIDELVIQGTIFISTFILVWTKDNSVLEEQCQICLSKYKMDDKALTMPCNHIFHEGCLKQWLESVMKFVIYI